MKVKFTIPGDPKGKGRHRTTRDGRSYTPRETVVYENLVKAMYYQSCGQARFGDEPLDMRVVAYYRIPESASKKKREAMINGEIRPQIKPDWDNVGKIVSDALNGIAYRDDKQIVDAQTRKFYSEQPRVVVTLQEAFCQAKGGDEHEPRT